MSSFITSLINTRLQNVFYVRATLKKEQNKKKKCKRQLQSNILQQCSMENGDLYLTGWMNWGLGEMTSSEIKSGFILNVTC